MKLDCFYTFKSKYVKSFFMHVIQFICVCFITMENCVKAKQLSHDGDSVALTHQIKPT